MGGAVVLLGSRGILSGFSCLRTIGLSPVRFEWLLGPRFVWGCGGLSIGFDVVGVASCVLLGFGVLLLFFFVAVRLVRRFWHFPTPWFTVGLIDNPVRRRIQSPRRVVDRLGLGPGMGIVEVGPGAGTFTMEAAKRLGEAGVVYAFDISREACRMVKVRARREKVGNVDAVVASAYDLPVVGCSVDRVFMVTVLAEIPDRLRGLKEFARVLKPDGLLSVSEFAPDPDYPLSRTVARWCREAGFVEVSRHGGLIEYTVNFRMLGSASLPSS